MPVDLSKVVRAALQAALEEPAAPEKRNKKSLLPPGRAVLLGAALMTAGRLATRGRREAILDSLERFVGEEDSEPEEALDLDDDDFDEEEVEDEDEEGYEDEEEYDDEEEPEPVASNGRRD